MSLRRNLLTRPLFHWARRVLPTMSDTEREALEAGDVWWDAELSTGNPDWAKLLATPPAVLSGEEKAFLDGHVAELCGMLDDWRITWELRDLPAEVWDFLKAKRFFGMIIPKEYGGLGFSAFAHSEVIRRISTRSITAAVTAMVPNSLGPGELLMRFGTKEQREYWLPRLADGREIPCFGLTSPEAGSDAASMIDSGVICRGTHQGREVLGLRLNWNKRYITLAPIATVLGLAFKAYDPDHLVGAKEELGITVALVPANAEGVETGRRHLPCYQPFENGPTSGRDVFVPLDAVIGGPERLGQGWKMLMSALAAGRGISLPALSAAGAAFAARTAGAYARVREQFNMPIGRFEGIEELLGRMAATAYLLEAARRLTCAALDQGHHPAVISAIMKLHATERMRSAVNDAMDIHGGKAIIDGPHNYLGNLFRTIPIGITVEGANVLTRNLIIYGQGAIRCHPYLFGEMSALAEADSKKGLEAFDKVFWRHAGHSLKTLAQAFIRNWSGGRLSPAPGKGAATRFYRQLSRYAASFATVSDVALLTLGGALKRKEMIAARLGDILSELYLLSAVLKRFEDEGQQAPDFPLVAWCLEAGFNTIEARLAAVIANLPNRVAAWILRLVCQPLGARHRGPADAMTRSCAKILLEPSEARERLTAGIHFKMDDGGVGRLERAFALVTENESIREKLRKARIRDWRAAEKSGLITAVEAKHMAAEEEAVAKAIAVDDFAPEALAQLGKALPGSGPVAARTRQSAAAS